VRAHTVAAIAIPATLALAPAALAQETNVTTLAESAKIGAEFRAEAIYDNHGLDKVKGYDPDATTDIGVTKARVKLSGNLNKQTTYAFRFNLWDPHATGTPLDYGYGTHWFTDMLGVTFGKAKVMQGGWDVQNGNFRDHAKGPLWDNLVFSEYAPMIALQAKVAGLVQLQVLDDVVDRTADDIATWNKTEHPTWILGWKGDFNGIQPLVDVGSYDNNKSMYVDVGIGAVMGGLNASLDFHQNMITENGTDTAGKQKDYKHTISNIALKARYDAGPVTPGLYFANYNVKQADDKKNGREDVKFNTTYDATGARNPVFDDNGNVAGVWVDVNTFGKGWTPYLAVVNQMGKFRKDPTSTKEESKSDLQVKLGCLGEF
jgi:hypothetical protein